MSHCDERMAVGDGFSAIDIESAKLGNFILAESAGQKPSAPKKAYVVSLRLLLDPTFNLSRSLQ